MAKLWQLSNRNANKFISQFNTFCLILVLKSFSDWADWQNRVSDKIGQNLLLRHAQTLNFSPLEKLHHKLTNQTHPPSTQSLTSSLAVPHLWYPLSARKPSSSGLCVYCSSCPLHQAAGSRDQKLQHLYASIPEDAAPFSPIEPLSALGELISSIEALHVTNPHT